MLGLCRQLRRDFVNLVRPLSKFESKFVYSISHPPTSGECNQQESLKSSDVFTYFPFTALDFSSQVGWLRTV
jgi:hypothetical protein